MTKEQKFKKEYAKELLGIAKGDLETTRILFNSNGGRKENICFNAQQVIEKSLKAILCHKEIAVPYTHNLEILFDRIPAELITGHWHQDANALTEYATVRRYEEGNLELDHEDLQAALSIAESAFSWASKIIV